MEAKAVEGEETDAKCEAGATPEAAPADEPKEGETEQYPNPYVEGFSRPSFLRKRLFSRQETWSTRKPVR